MPNYPVHNFGTNKIAAGGFLGMQNRQEKQEKEKNMMRQLLVAGAEQGALSDEPNELTTSVFGDAAGMVHGMSKQVKDKNQAEAMQQKFDNMIDVLGKSDSIFKLIDNMEDTGQPPEAISRAVDYINKVGGEGFSFNVTKYMDAKKRKETQEKGYTGLINEGFLKLEDWNSGKLAKQGVGPQMGRLIAPSLLTLINKYGDKYGKEKAEVYEGMLENIMKPQSDYSLGPDQQRRSGVTNQVIARGPAKTATPGAPTDADKYIGDKGRAYMTENNVKAVPPSLKAQWRIQFKRGEGKELTRKEINTTLANLHKGLARLKSGKGLDELMLAILPEEQRAKVLGGDVSAGVAEFEQQIAEYEGLRKETPFKKAVEAKDTLPKGLTEPVIKFYETNHGLSRDEVIKRFKAKGK